MKISIKQILFFLLLLTFSLPMNASSAPKRENRAVWFTTVWGLDWPSSQGTTAAVQAKQKEQLISYLDKLSKTGINTIYFQVRSMSDAMYKSSYEPWSSYLSGTRGADPGWDPLTFAVEECHKRGLECHAWINPYRFSSGSDWNTDLDKAVKESGVLMTTGSNIIWNPGLEATRKRIVNVISEIVNNYQVDGVLFDDYFYTNGTTTGSAAPDYQLWQDSKSGMSISDWRRANVNLMVKNVYDAIQSLRPDIRFGISPAGVAGTGGSASKHGVSACPVGSDWQYDGIYSDPLAWLEEGTIDFISPQLYWTTDHKTNPFGPLTKWWGEVAEHFGRHHYASHSISFLSSANTEANWKEVASQIDLSRQYRTNDASGCVFYSTKYIDGPTCKGLGDYLEANTFTTKSLMPVITWKQHPNYGTVSNLSLSDNTLSWTKIQNGKAIIKYTVYAIPCTVPVTDIYESDNDGIKKEYLKGVSYDGTFNLNNINTDDYWYAVCVYDGYGTEYAPATLNAPSKPSEKPELSYPTNDVVVDWNVTFKWSALADAVYTVQISDDSSFSNIIFEQKKIKTNSLDVVLDFADSSKKYYWRVNTVETGKLESTSDYSSFVTKQKNTSAIPTLLTPAQNSETTTDVITFSWSKVNVANQKIEISTTADFSNNVIEKELSTEINSLDVQASQLGLNKIYWRITTSSPFCFDGTSTVGQFTVKDYSVGKTEAGYYVHKEDATYETVDNISISNAWIRRVSDDSANKIFDETGSLNRGFCVADNVIYVTERSAASASADICLRKFNATTGEMIGTLNLSDEGKIANYPCNDVIKDSKGNICITNLSTGITSSPLVVFQVNTATGELTKRAECKISGRVASRVDHAAIYGDVTTGNFSVFAVFASTKNIYRFTIENGALTATDKCVASTLYPNESSFGIAPMIIALDANTILIDGSTTAMSKYNFATGEMTGSFAENTSLSPESYGANGGAVFDLNNIKYMVYPISDNTNDSNYSFRLVKSDKALTFSSMKNINVLPKTGLGNINNQIARALAQYVEVKEGEGRLYFYVPGNGLAAYDVKDISCAGAEGIDVAPSLSMWTNGNVVYFSSTVDNIEVFNMEGTLVARAKAVNSLKMNVSAGTYAVRTTSGNNIANQVIIIK